MTIPSDIVCNGPVQSGIPRAAIPMDTHSLHLANQGPSQIPKSSESRYLCRLEIDRPLQPAASPTNYRRVLLRSYSLQILNSSTVVSSESRLIRAPQKFFWVVAQPALLCRFLPVGAAHCHSPVRRSPQALTVAVAIGPK